jgi:hypothetical protein
MLDPPILTKSVTGEVGSGTLTLVYELLTKLVTGETGSGTLTLFVLVVEKNLVLKLES